MGGAQVVEQSPDKLFDILGVLCVEYGFCLPEPEAWEICNMKGLNPLEIARAVIKADGGDPDYNAQHVTLLEKKISQLLNSQTEP